MNKKNIVWITLDSIRRDHTSLGNYERDTTPELRRAAEADRGCNLNAYSHAIWSNPSNASILTGTYPEYHGVGLRNEVLPEDIPTIGQLLSDVGYTTVGLSFNPYFNTETRTNRGFDRFEWVDKQNLLSTAGIKTIFKYVSQLPWESAGFTTDAKRHSEDYLSAEITRDWIRSLAADDQPFFLYTHWVGAHTPWYPPKPYRERFAENIALDASEAAETVFEYSSDPYRETAAGPDYTEREREAIDAMYDSAIRYTDAQVGRVLDYVDEALNEETTVVVTADHGDLLGEKGVFGHKLAVHDGLINVPLVVYGECGLGDRRGSIVQHADVMQTLASGAGADVSSMQGVTLTDQKRRYAVAQRGPTTYRNTISTIREKYDPGFEASGFPEGLVTCIVDGEFKLRQAESREDLFELPNERDDISATLSGVAEMMSGALEQWRSSIPEPVTTNDAVEMTERRQQQLHDLGYLN
jgi:uncharacterized sulfatase